jgi:acetyl-CoA carboxylase biotin carboxyl carrier protein
MTIKAQDITTLVEMFEASRWDELHVEIDGLHLFLSTDPNARLANGAAPPPAAVVPSAIAPVTAQVVTAPAGTAAPTKAAAKPEPASSDVPSHWVDVKAPNLGTFYRAPKPGAAPFVEVGQTVDASTEICLLEVMKLFTTVTAGTRGIVRRVCVNDGDLVEFGQTLFYVETV